MGYCAFLVLLRQLGYASLCGLSNFFAFYYSVKNAEERGFEIKGKGVTVRFSGMTHNILYEGILAKAPRLVNENY